MKEINDLRIALLQQDIIWEDPRSNFGHIEDILSENTEPFDLLILPETFNTGFSQNARSLAEKPDGKTFAWCGKMAREHGCKVMASWYVVENGDVYNRLYCIGNEGEASHYDKRHTFRLSTESHDVRCGESPMVVELNGWKISPFVCYDLRFPTWCRNSFRNDAFAYDIAVFVANWPASRSKAWKTLLQARALENQCYAIGVNRVGKDGQDTPHAGNSMVVSPNGNVIHQTEENHEELKVFSLNNSNLERYREKYPFHLDWD